MAQRHSTAWSSIAWPTAAHLSRAGHTPSIPARPTGNVPATGGIVSWTVEWSQNNIPVTGVRVSPSSVNLDVGRTHTLSAMVLPTNATNQTVTWTSSNTLVATVSSSGVVTANSAGTATITARAGNGQFSDTSTISINRGGGCNIPGCGVYPINSPHFMHIPNPHNITIRLGCQWIAESNRRPQVLSAINNWNNTGHVTMSATTSGSSTVTLLTSGDMDPWDMGRWDRPSGEILINRQWWNENERLPQGLIDRGLPVPSGAPDISAVDYILRHEIGHFLGLAHPHCNETACMHLPERGFFWADLVTTHDREALGRRFQR